MKTNLRYFHLIIICILLIGCTTTRQIKPEKFEVDFRLMKRFRSNVPIQVLVPQNAETNYLIEYSGKRNPYQILYVDLNDLYRNAKELIEQTLANYNVPLSPNSQKHLRFVISRVQWEIWGGGYLIGSYLEFDIETGDGYKIHYRVQDQSANTAARAVGGTISRAVEKIFQDEKIIAYLQLQ